MIFAWLRHKTRDAILEGIADAAAAIDAPTDGPAADPLAALRQRLALPAPATVNGVQDYAANGRKRSAKSE